MATQVIEFREALGREGVGPAAGSIEVEVAPSAASPSQEPVPGIVEVLAPSGHIIRLTPPIDLRVLKAAPAGLK